MVRWLGGMQLSCKPLATQVTPSTINIMTETQVPTVSTVSLHQHPVSGYHLRLLTDRSLRVPQQPFCYTPFPSAPFSGLKRA
jgi:hypothetical protein